VLPAVGSAGAAERIPVHALRAHTHVHGLAVDRTDPTYLLIATHHGLFRAGLDGMAERISVVQDFMGFTPHPSDADVLYASGHPAAGGNLGFIVSEDGGKTWRELSLGVDGPVDFHQMAVSPANPRTIYGVYGAIQVSTDGGRTWEVAGRTPEKLIDLAASAADMDTLYAATESGLLRSQDRGKTWEAILARAPVTLVEVTPDGTLRAFVYEQGLVKTRESPIAWTSLEGDWGNRFLLHLAVDPTDADRLYGATGSGVILKSSDGGKSWVPFGD
jgi:photosystem II stability/assembly factor-like uncharacterized protein